MQEQNWLALSLISGLGYKKIQQLLAHFGTVEEILKASADELIQSKLSPKLANRISGAYKSRSFQIEQRLIEEDSELRVWCPESLDYPEPLKHISTPPTVLYWKGNLTLSNHCCIAVVGSRSCTKYGRTHTRRLVLELAEQIPNLVIVSGMARGIDTVAHHAALEAGVPTIAVLAGGLRHLYPPENIELSDSIRENGALVTEFPLTMRPIGKNFPIRNRIISGLSLGVLLTEARKKSGANITAAFALQQNREIFALPGRVDSASSEGSNQLIARQHAQLVVSASDIIENLNLSTSASKSTQLSLQIEEKPAIQLKNYSPDQAKTLQAISDGISDIDAIHIKTDIDIGTLLGILVELELLGVVKSIGGESYTLEEGVELEESKRK